MAKLIYSPKGAALEYAKYAFNGYVGCAGMCHYCYNRKGITAKVLGADKPTLRKCFKDEADAIIQFTREVSKNIAEYKEHGIFFSFVGDCLCEEQKELTIRAISVCLNYDITPTLLTKQIRWIKDFPFAKFEGLEHKIKFGFTLTGMDLQEPNCPTSHARIEALNYLNDKGFYTWVSLEPVIDLEKSFEMFINSNLYVDEYKIGLLSHKKYDAYDIKEFVRKIEGCNAGDSKIVWKESVKKYL